MATTVLFSTQHRETEELQGISLIKKRMRQDIHLRCDIGQGAVAHS